MVKKYIFKIILLCLLFPIVTACMPRNFNVPGSSMEPTLHIGDIILAYLGIYDYENRLPQAGDILLVQMPQPNVIYVKRLIGLPGDTVQMQNGVVILNKKPVKQEYLGEITIPDVSPHPVILQRETLPNGVSYYILDLMKDTMLDNTKEFIVPPEHYFVMGDNRDNSNDSRFEMGYVSQKDIMGKASFIWWRAFNGFSGRSSFLTQEQRKYNRHLE